MLCVQCLCSDDLHGKDIGSCAKHCNSQDSKPQHTASHKQINRKTAARLVTSRYRLQVHPDVSTKTILMIGLTSRQLHCASVHLAQQMLQSYFQPGIWSS